ncbi:MAG: NADH-quinone oxidoreductase subunit NuoE [Deltaproteobacteria bacterium]|jgi:NADH-quinone oxidoreductase subunit E|nr:NADH-quinone oxidoreductase subunit NuoE [Deltaproteobacteria bacterium]
MDVDLSPTKTLIEKYSQKKGALIPLLQDIQAAYGYVPDDAVQLVAQELAIFPVEIYGVLTFYTQFYLTPRGKHTIRVCQGTACHVMGAKGLFDYLLEKLELEEGETTKDGFFTVERVACLGCCGMAPVIMIDDDFYGRCTIQNIEETWNKYRSETAES